MDGNDFEWSEMLVGYKAYGHMGVICAGIDFAIVVGLPWSKDIAYNMKCIRCISQRRINTKSKHPGSNLDVWLSSKIICCKFWAYTSYFRSRNSRFGMPYPLLAYIAYPTTHFTQAYDTSMISAEMAVNGSLYSR